MSRNMSDAKGWPFPPLDPATMSGVGLRPCSIFGMNEAQEDTIAVATCSAHSSTPTCLQSGEQVGDTAAEGCKAEDEPGQSAADGCKKTSSPPTSAAHTGPADTRTTSAPILVYMPLVKNEEVDEELEPLTTPWCDLFEFAYEVGCGLHDLGVQCEIAVFVCGGVSGDTRGIMQKPSAAMEAPRAARRELSNTLTRLGETQREHYHRLLRLAEANVERSRPQILDAIKCSLRRKKQECHARAAASSGSGGAGN